VLHARGGGEVLAEALLQWRAWRCARSRTGWRCVLCTESSPSGGSYGPARLRHPSGSTLTRGQTPAAGEAQEQMQTLTAECLLELAAPDNVLHLDLCGDYLGTPRPLPPARAPDRSAGYATANEACVLELRLQARPPGEPEMLQWAGAAELPAPDLCAEFTFDERGLLVEPASRALRLALSYHPILITAIDIIAIYRQRHGRRQGVLSQAFQRGLRRSGYAAGRGGAGPGGRYGARPALSARRCVPRSPHCPVPLCHPSRAGASWPARPACCSGDACALAIASTHWLCCPFSSPPCSRYALPLPLS
jgi:hypothetical protein